MVAPDGEAGCACWGAGVRVGCLFLAPAAPTRPILLGAAEFGATVFIARPDNPTLPVAVARLLGRPGDLN
ncbi:hypothetical protein, partial [Streptomyces sp. NPDC000878]